MNLIKRYFLPKLILMSCFLVIFFTPVLGERNPSIDIDYSTPNVIVNDIPTNILTPRIAHPFDDVAYPYYILQMNQGLHVHHTKFRAYLKFTVNANTPGYRRYKVTATKLKNGDLVPIQYIDMRPSTVLPSSYPLDIDVSGKKNFFTVQLHNGDAAYTYDGRFAIDKDGLLITRMLSFPVLGTNGKIYLPDQNVDINAKGDIYHNEQYIDTLRITSFKHFLGLWSFQGTIFYIKDRDKVQFDDAPFYSVAQHFYEQSNEQPAIGEGALAVPFYEGISRTAKEIFMSHDHLFQSTGPD